MNHPTPPTKPELVLIVNPNSRTSTSTNPNTSLCVEPKTPKPDAYVQFLMDECVDRIPDLALRQFMDAVFSQPEVIRILGEQVIQDGKPTGLRILHLYDRAGDVLRHAQLDGDEFEAVYASCFLHGISYFLPCGVNESPNSVRHAWSTNVSNALCSLESTNPDMARLVRLCMGWGHCGDEEAVFTEWLQQRMQRAIGTLELVKF
jgi:hypothetical protein